MKKFGLIGLTLQHSFSQEYFTQKFEDEGIHANYRLFELPGIGHFRELLQNEQDLSGLNVTIPYKQLILPYLDELSAEADEIGAVNTISFSHKDGKLNLKGWNTDAPAFQSEIIRLAGNEPSHALILGSGGASAAAAFALRKSGWTFQTVSRKKSNPDFLLYSELRPEIMSQTRLIVNATPLGMFPNIKGIPDMPWQWVNERHLLFDMVYNPGNTMFMQRGKAQGARVCNGLGMLKMQAELAWRIWHGETD